LENVEVINDIEMFNELKSHLEEESSWVVEEHNEVLKVLHKDSSPTPFLLPAALFSRHCSGLTPICTSSTGCAMLFQL
jgi:hypothetical protein